MPLTLPAWLTERAVRPVLIGLVAGGMVAGGVIVSLGVGPGARAHVPGGPAAEPPRPPAACLLDTARLAADTGIEWTADAVTAGDTRCVYDPAGAQAEVAFITVTLSTATPDTVDEVCDSGSRSPVPGTAEGFVCRFESDTVIAAARHGDQVVTLTAAAAPKGTTTAKVETAFAHQLAS